MRRGGQPSVPLENLKIRIASSKCLQLRFNGVKKGERVRGICYLFQICLLLGLFVNQPLLGSTFSTQGPISKSTVIEGFQWDPQKLSLAEQKVWRASVRVGVEFVDTKKVSRRQYGSSVILAKITEAEDLNKNKQRLIIATNSHVIACKNPVEKESVGNELEQPCNNIFSIYRWIEFFDFNDPKKIQKSYATFRVMYDRPEVDLALLTIDIPKSFSAFEVAELRSPQKMVEGAVVKAIGYPALKLRKEDDWQTGLPEGLKKYLKWASEGKFLSYSSHFPLIAKKGEPIQYAPVILHTADLLKGNSGGPLLDQDGYVIGLNTQLFGTNATTGFKYCADLGPNCFNVSISSDLIRWEVRHQIKVNLPLELFEN